MMQNMFMQFSQMMGTFMSGQGPPQSFQGPTSFQGQSTQFDPRQQQQQQQQQQQPLSQQQQQELIAQQQQQEHQIHYNQQQEQYRHHQQQLAQQSPQRNQQLFQSPSTPQQHQHYVPEQYQPDVNRYLHGPGPAPPPPGQIVQRHPEEQIEFHAAPQHQLALPQQLKRSPGGAGQTFMTPPAKKKSAGTNASSEYYASAPDATFEDSPSEGAGGVL
jgi:flagellar biosynthesis GTPase FlhF